MEQHKTYDPLNIHAERLEALAGKGIIHPEKAIEICREIRTELYALRQTINDLRGPDDPQGPSAA